MSRENQEAQEDELLALSSIFPEDEFRRADTSPGGEIQVCLELPPNFRISVKCNSASNTMESFENTVSFLPPIVLDFEFPPGYPSTTCPIFTLSCKWLSPEQLTLMCHRLDDLWEENRGSVVLFAWMQFLKEETLEYLNIKSPYEVQFANNEKHTLMEVEEEASFYIAAAAPEEYANLCIAAAAPEKYASLCNAAAAPEKYACLCIAAAAPEENGSFCNAAVAPEKKESLCIAAASPEQESSLCIAAASPEQEASLCIAAAAPEEEASLCIAAAAPEEEASLCIAAAAPEKYASLCNAAAAPEKYACLCIAAAAPEENGSFCNAAVAPEKKESLCIAAASPEQESSLCIAAASPEQEASLCIAAAAPEEEASLCIAAAAPEEEASLCIAAAAPEKYASLCIAAAAPEKEAVDRRAIQDVQSVYELIRHILDFEESQQKKCFDSKQFLCNICFSEKLGSECTYFKECSHVYCDICLRDYFEIQIRDGQVHALNCPEPECKSVATPTQVKKLVGEELFGRYDRLLLKSTLELMTDVVYCPRLSCQTPVMQEPGGTMGICTSCQYAFCTLCMMTYHGLSKCNDPESEFTEPTLEDPNPENPDSLDNNDGDGDQLPIRGKGKGARRKRQQEWESKKWIEVNSKSCPRCRSKIQKLSGCNKMTCTQCGSYFCWMCGVLLAKYNPYDHFRDTDCAQDS